MATLFLSIDYRNGRYQGPCQDDHLPNGQGIFLDDHMRLTLSQWHNGLMSGSTLLFDSHSKYIYGSWERGLPHGVNVYRGGDTVLLGNFEQGEIVGRFVVIFELQKLMLTVEVQKGEAVIVGRNQGVKQEDVLEAARGIGLGENVQEIISLVKYLERWYSAAESGVSFKTLGDRYLLGIPNGLGILFNEDNFVCKVGHLAEDLEVSTIGAIHTHSSSEEGNFETGEVVSYRQERPEEQIKEILKYSHLKSLTFKNQYFLTKASQSLQYMDEVLRGQLVSQLAQGQLQESRRFDISDINDSLQYQPRDKSENQRLRKMRAELYLSIGIPGSEIKPVEKQRLDDFIAHTYKHNKTPMRYQDYQQEFDPYKQPTARFEDGLYHVRERSQLRRPEPEPLLSSITFGKNSNSPLKYEDIKDRRARLLNEYKGIHHRSPSRASLLRQPIRPSSQLNNLLKHDSPYHYLDSTPAEPLHTKARDSLDTNIKTVSRRVDTHELPSRSPGRRYSYLNTFM